LNRPDTYWPSPSGFASDPIRPTGTGLLLAMLFLALTSAVVGFVLIRDESAPASVGEVGR